VPRSLPCRVSQPVGSKTLRERHAEPDGLDDLSPMSRRVIERTSTGRTHRRLRWRADLSLGADTRGGTVVFEGTPRDLAASSTTTGTCLREHLAG